MARLGWRGESPPSQSSPIEGEEVREGGMTMWVWVCVGGGAGGSRAAPTRWESREMGSRLRGSKEQESGRFANCLYSSRMGLYLRKQSKQRGLAFEVLEA